MATAIPPRIASGALVGIAESIRKIGLDPADFIELEPDGLESETDVYKDIDFPYLLSIYKRVAERTRQGDIGLQLGKAVDLNRIGPFGHLLRNAPDVGAALKDFVRFFPVLQSQAYVGLRDVGKQICIEYSSNHPEIPGWEIDSDATVGFIIRIVNTITESNLVPTRIHFDHPPNEGSFDNSAYAKRTPSYGRHFTRVFYPATIMSLPTRGADPFLYSILSRHMRDLARAIPDDDDLVSQIGNTIRKRLGTASVAIRDVADELGQGTRTLQRRLKKHDTNYQAVLDDVRLELAQSLLAGTTLDITQVGVNVGFADASAFSHSFKKWTGVTPGEYRQANASTSA